MAAFNAMTHEAHRSCEYFLSAEVEKAPDPRMQRATRGPDMSQRTAVAVHETPLQAAIQMQKVFPLILLTTCELEAARDCACRRNGSHPPELPQHTSTHYGGAFRQKYDTVSRMLPVGIRKARKP